LRCATWEGRDGLRVRHFFGTHGKTGNIDMIEIMSTNDVVLLSRVETILEEAGIPGLIADRHTSAVEGSLGFLPRRVLVGADDAARARRLLVEAGLGAELRDG
jgi:hypothetical protein